MSLLRLAEVTKTFGGLTAVNKVSFTVDEGAVVGLIGPNGAGKTTTFNLITGNYRPTAGAIFFQDQDITGLPTHRIVTMGIARTFQTIRLFQNLSVVENVLAGIHCRLRSGFFSALLGSPGQRREEQNALAAALAELDFVGLGELALSPAGSLSYGNQRLLEIARALGSGPRCLILDEPAGGMNEQETESLIRLIGRLSERGITVLLIEHDMTLVMRACQHLVVLEYGEKIAEGSPVEVQQNPRVIEAYLGVD